MSSALILKKPIPGTNQVFDYWNGNSDKLRADIEKIKREASKTKKTGHWIWYVYPNVERATSYPPEISIQHYKGLLGNDYYLETRKIVDSKELEWFTEADDERVFDFRINEKVQNLEKEFGFRREYASSEGDGTTYQLVETSGGGRRVNPYEKPLLDIIQRNLNIVKVKFGIESDIYRAFDESLRVKN